MEAYEYVDTVDFRMEISYTGRTRLTKGEVFMLKEIQKSFCSILVAIKDIDKYIERVDTRVDIHEPIKYERSSMYRLIDGYI